MSQAKPGNTTSRREALKLLTAAPIAGAVPFTALAMTAPADPVFAVIEAHQRVQADYDAAVRENFRLEATLPEERRKSRVTALGEEIVDTDDPAWIASERAACCHAVDEIAFALAATHPTTLAGVAAVLGYAADYVERGESWPDFAHLGDDRDWFVTLHRTLAAALAEIGGAA